MTFYMSYFCSTTLTSMTIPEWDAIRRQIRAKKFSNMSNDVTVRCEKSHTKFNDVTYSTSPSKHGFHNKTWERKNQITLSVELL